MKQSTKFGDMLKRLRFQKNWTQQQLADITGINKASISNYERGHRNPPYAVICAIAEAFNIPEDDLLDCVIPEHSIEGNTSKENRADSIRQRRIKRLIEAFDRLSNDAQIKMIEHGEELGLIPTYQRKLSDNLQQYVYNRCRTKMQISEKPLEHNTFKSWSHSTIHYITKCIKLSDNKQPAWYFYYLSFSKDYELETDGIIKILNTYIQDIQETNDNVTVFIFDSEAMYHVFHDVYENELLDDKTIPALFFLIDKNTLEIKQDK